MALDAQPEMSGHHGNGQKFPVKQAVVAFGSNQGLAEEAKWTPITFELLQNCADPGITGIQADGQGSVMDMMSKQTGLRKESLALWKEETRSTDQEMTVEGRLWSTSLCSGAKMEEALGMN